MEQDFIFQITAMDKEALLPQVKAALEKRTELDSRKKNPKLWNLTDQLNSMGNVSEEVREKRRKRTSFLSLIDWMLAVFALLPALMEPKELTLLLIVGTLCLGVGIVGLWQTKRMLLGVVSLLLSGFLCIGALGNLEELGNLLILGVAHGIIGLAALISRKRKKKDPFGCAAKQILEQREHLQEGSGLQAEFSPTGMILFQEGSSEQKEVPYYHFEFVVETKDLWLLTFEDKVTVLQKKDLVTGTEKELKTFLRKHTSYTAVSEVKKEKL